ncbi:MAG TPA: DNA polymerase III subunit delta [Bacilli bacterium]|nr:DNA polymerase III subunit delta [Bacilli bacterium]
MKDLIYLFSGKEKHIIKTKILRLITELTDDPDSVTQYDLDYTNVIHALSDASTIPFLTQVKVIMMKNPRFLTQEGSDINHDLEAFIRYIKKPVETTYMIIDAGGLELDSKNDVYRQLRNYAVISETKELSDIEIMGWIKRQFDIEKINIEDSAVSKIYEYSGNDLTRAKNEIDKLISFAADEARIDSSDVVLLLSRNVENEIFEIINCLLRKDQEQVIQIYYDLTKGIQDPMGINAMISRSMKDLLTVSKLTKVGYNQGDIATIMNINPGRAFYLMKDAKNYKEQDLSTYVKKLAELDYQIKSGKIDRTIGIEFLLLGK